MQLLSVVRGFGTDGGVIYERILLIWLVGLCSGFAVKQAPSFDGFPFGPFALFQNCLASSELDISGCEILQALVVAPVIVVINEGVGLLLEVSRQIVFSNRMRFFRVWCQRSIFP
jgi:hypothetical protein